MRKKMTKEVTKTTVKIAKVQNVDGQLSTEQLDDLVLIGNVSAEKAQKQVHKELGLNATVFGVETSTEVYEMDVEEFIKHATLKTDSEETEITE